jgi:hypothetical protein
MFREIERLFGKLTKNYNTCLPKSDSLLGVSFKDMSRLTGKIPSSSLDMPKQLGLGEVFRNMLMALDSTGMPFAIYPFDKNVEARRYGHFLESHYDRKGVYDIDVAHMATDQLPHYFSQLRKQVRGSRYNILQTYWELVEAPRVWRSLLKRIGELWVPNSYVADECHLLVWFRVGGSRG